MSHQINQEIEKLLKRSNKQHALEFISFLGDKYPKMNELYNDFISEKIPETGPVHCHYIYKRGTRINNRCNTVVKDGHFCSKHKKVKLDDVHPTSKIELDLANLSDEDSDESEENENEAEVEETDDVEMEEEEGDWNSDADDY
jgi:hypothetical protein